MPKRTRKPKRQTPAFVYLNGASGYMQDALFEDERVGDFVMTTEDGRKITFIDARYWIARASEHFEAEEERRVTESN